VTFFCYVLYFTSPDVRIVGSDNHFINVKMTALELQCQNLHSWERTGMLY